MPQGNITNAFVFDNALPAEIGEGTISYVQDAANTRTIQKVVGTTGHPYLSGSLTGDYWLFQIPVKETLPAGTVMHIKFITRSAAGAARYWSLEYLDNESWKPHFCTAHRPSSRRISNLYARFGHRPHGQQESRFGQRTDRQ